LFLCLSYTDTDGSHRDIKPDNFVVGFGSQASKIFLIDFGLAKCYARNDGTCIPYRSGKSFVGNFRFAGIGTQSGIGTVWFYEVKLLANSDCLTEPARRDDLEAVGYVLAYFFKGDLPWRRFEKKLDPERILEEKRHIPSVALCPQIPMIGALIDYARMLNYEERPSYARWITSFAHLQPSPYCPDHLNGTCKFEWEKR
jgi:serine/threonine protein kinase